MTENNDYFDGLKTLCIYLRLSLLQHPHLGIFLKSIPSF